MTEVIDLTPAHNEPHFDLMECCGCECSRCTVIEKGWSRCICPDCDVPRCGLH